MQLDQARDVLGRLLVEAECPHPRGRQLGPDHLVVVEADPAAGLEPARGRLADVVHQGRQPQHQVRAGHDRVGVAVVRLQRDRLLQHGEGVLVDVLVPVVLVDLQAQGGQLGQHVVGQAGVHQQRQAGTRVTAQEQLDQLVTHPFARHDPDLLRHAPHRGGRGLVRAHPQLGREPGRTHHAQRVVAEGPLRRPRRTQPARDEVVHAAERVDELQVRQAHRHGVDGEVAAFEVVVEGVAEHHDRLAGLAVVGVGPVGRDLHRRVAATGADGAEVTTHVPRRVGPPGDGPLDLFRARVGGQVQVGHGTAEERVAHRPAHQGQLVTRGDEPLAELTGQRQERRQGRRGTTEGGRTVFGHGGQGATGRSVLAVR